MYISGFKVNLLFFPDLSMLSNTDCSQPQPLSFHMSTLSRQLCLRVPQNKLTLLIKLFFLPSNFLIHVLLIQTWNGSPFLASGPNSEKEWDGSAQLSNSHALLLWQTPLFGTSGPCRAWKANTSLVSAHRWFVATFIIWINHLRLRNHRGHLLQAHTPGSILVIVVCIEGTS